MTQTREILDGVEEEFLLLGILDVSVDEQAVHLRMDVLDRNLKSVETTSLWDLIMEFKIS